MQLSRRDLLKLGTGATAGLILGHRDIRALGNDTMLANAGAGGLARQGNLIRKAIPSTGEEIPVIGLGSAGTFNLSPGRQGYEDAQAVVRLFRELGGSVIDTSPTYQRSEPFLGETVQQLGIADEIFVATKVNVGGAGKTAAIAQMEQSLRTYGRESLDLIQVWNLGDSIRSLSNRFLETHMEALQEMKVAGRIRYLGISTSRDPQYTDLEAAMQRYTLDFVQLDYSIGDRVPERRLLPLARERGIAVLANRPFTTGNLFGRVRRRELPSWVEEYDIRSWAQFFLKFIVSHPAVTCTIPATGDPDHLRDNMGACHGRLPEESARERMVRVFEEL
jgi:diketogulonate reductase-like aldo/keto reductase